jgi:hypothetical protein
MLLSERSSKSKEVVASPIPKIITKRLIWRIVYLSQEDSQRLFFCNHRCFHLEQQFYSIQRFTEERGRLQFGVQRWRKVSCRRILAIDF